MAKRREKKPITYGEAHNRAVRMYRRTSIFLLWAGIVNFFSVIIGVIQFAAGTHLEVNGIAQAWPTSGFSLSLTLQMYLNSLLIPSLQSGVSSFLMILIAAILGGAFAFIGLMASKGRKEFLFIGTGLYTLDFIAMFFVYTYSNVPSVYTNYMFTLVLHSIILVASVIAIVEYYNVIHIEKVFNNKNNASLEEEEESEVIASGK